MTRPAISSYVVEPVRPGGLALSIKYLYCVGRKKKLRSKAVVGDGTRTFEGNEQ